MHRFIEFQNAPHQSQSFAKNIYHLFFGDIAVSGRTDGIDLRIVQTNCAVVGAYQEASTLDQPLEQCIQRQIAIDILHNLPKKRALAFYIGSGTRAQWVAYGNTHIHSCVISRRWFLAAECVHPTG
ncbi:MAG: hypothetical protein ABJA62_02935 [Luteimonas sp.]